MDNIPKNSAAKIAANNRYREKHYRKLSVDVKFAEFDFIDNLAKSRNMSKASLIVKAMHYIHDNNIDLNTDDDDTMP